MREAIDAKHILSVTPKQSFSGKVRDREDAIASTRDARATQKFHPRHEGSCEHASRSYPRLMSLQKRIDEDLKDAMRAKDAARLSVLRLLKAALKNAEKVGAERELNDPDAVAVIRKQVKQRQDSIESFEKGGRADLAEKEKAEIAVLNNYLPQAMSAAELQTIVADTIREVGATSRAQMGAVMKALQPKIAGRADGKTLSAEVQKRLQ